VRVFSAKPPFDPLAALETGPITNHVNFSTNRNSRHSALPRSLL
jgi:hypothetical protein